MKNKYIIIPILLLCILSSVFSQSKVVFEFNQKLLLADFSGLNRQIKDIYPTLDDGMVTEFQIGWTIVSPKSSLGLHGIISTILNQKQRPKQTIFNGYGAGLRYTYNVLKESSIKLSPELAFGFRKYNLVLGETASGVSIEDVLNYPINNYVFSNFGAYLDLGLGLSKNFKIKLQKDSYYDLSFGLSGGYRFDKGEWLYEGINPVYHEIAKLSGIYIDIKALMRISNTKKDDNNE